MLSDRSFKWQEVSDLADGGPTDPREKPWDRVHADGGPSTSLEVFNTDWSPLVLGEPIKSERL